MSNLQLAIGNEKLAIGVGRLLTRSIITTAYFRRFFYYKAVVNNNSLLQSFLLRNDHSVWNGHYEQSEVIL